MDANLPSILIVGTGRSLPGPLASLLSRHRINMIPADDLFQAAARLRSVEPHCRAILLDPERLGPHQMELLSILKQHVTVPMCLLPGRGAHRIREKSQAMGLCGSWEEAMRSIEQCLQEGITQGPVEGNTSESREPVLTLPESSRGFALQTDNGAPDGASEKPEIPMVSKVVERYDDSMGAALLSEEEIHALLDPDQ